jgi:hypothetical protein
MSASFRYSVATAVLLVTACGSSVQTSRMGGVFPAREPNCSLEMRTETMTMEFLSAYQTIGFVSVAGEENEAPNSPKILALLKPEACGLGGEIVGVSTSANVTNGLASTSSHQYMVFRKKSVNAALQKF